MVWGFGFESHFLVRPENIGSERGGGAISSAINSEEERLEQKRLQREEEEKVCSFVCVRRRPVLNDDISSQGQISCLLLIDKARAKDKAYLYMSVGAMKD